MDNRFSRTELLLGKENMEKLSRCRVAVFGVGGVGGYAFEALVRSGVGEIDIFDNDKVDITNLNRQIIATNENIGTYKVDAAYNRAKIINPEIKINKHCVFYDKESAEGFDFSCYDYIIDAIDSVSSKLLLIENAVKSGVPIISSMGTGNKLNPTLLEVSDIYKTSVCPLAKVMRYELKKRGIKNLKVVYSKEEPIKITAQNDTKKTIGSISFVPATAGLIIASEVIKGLTNS